MACIPFQLSLNQLTEWARPEEIQQPSIRGAPIILFVISGAFTLADLSRFRLVPSNPFHGLVALGWLFARFLILHQRARGCTFSSRGLSRPRNPSSSPLPTFHDTRNPPSLPAWISQADFPIANQFPTTPTPPPMFERSAESNSIHAQRLTFLIVCSILASYYTKNFLCKHPLRLPRKMQHKRLTPHFSTCSNPISSIRAGHSHWIADGNPNKHTHSRRSNCTRDF